jgi:hypothetical protein
MKKITAALCATLLCGSLALADDIKSLIGFEGGYSELGISNDATGGAAYDATESFAHGGIKIGAESRNYRFFLSGRYYDVADFEHLTTMGAELQYLMNFTSWMNMYFGASIGIMDAEFKDATAAKRTLSDMYYGGDVGFNFHLGDSVDFEIGARVIDIQADNTVGGVTYTLDPMITGYGSLIFKFNLDDI